MIFFNFNFIKSLKLNSNFGLYFQFKSFQSDSIHSIMSYSRTKFNLNSNRVKIAEYYWKDVKPLKLDLGVTINKNSFTSRDIFYQEENGEKYSPIITMIPTRAGIIKKRFDKYGLHLIFSNETVSLSDTSKTEEERKQELEEKKREVKEFIEWQQLCHRVIVVKNYLRDQEEKLIKKTTDKTFEEILLNDNELLNSILHSSKFTDYDLKASDEFTDPLWYLRLNSADPYSDDYNRRTNFSDVTGDESEKTHQEIVSKMMNFSSEIVPSVRYHNISSNAGIQYRFTDAVLLGYFIFETVKNEKPKVKKITIERFKNENTIKNYQRTNKKASEYYKK